MGDLVGGSAGVGGGEGKKCAISGDLRLFEAQLLDCTRIVSGLFIQSVVSQGDPAAGQGEKTTESRLPTGRSFRKGRRAAGESLDARGSREKSIAKARPAFGII